MIEKIGHYSLENPASVYDEEAMTALELAGRTAHKTNLCIEQVNKIPDSIKAEVQEQIENGTFDKQIDHYAGELEAQVKASEASCQAQVDGLETSLGNRLDNLLGSVSAGSTTLDAEVIDLRVDAENHTNTNAGQAIRNNFMALNARVKDEMLTTFYSLSDTRLESEEITLTEGWIVRAMEGYEVSVINSVTDADSGWRTHMLLPIDEPFTVKVRHDNDLPISPAECSGIIFERTGFLSGGRYAEHVWVWSAKYCANKHLLYTGNGYQVGVPDGYKMHITLYNADTPSADNVFYTSGWVTGEIPLLAGKYVVIHVQRNDGGDMDLNDAKAIELAPFECKKVLPDCLVRGGLYDALQPLTAEGTYSNTRIRTDVLTFTKAVEVICHGDVLFGVSWYDDNGTMRTTSGWVTHDTIPAGVGCSVSFSLSGGGVINKDYALENVEFVEHFNEDTVLDKIRRGMYNRQHITGASSHNRLLCGPITLDEEITLECSGDASIACLIKDEDGSNVYDSAWRKKYTYPAGVPLYVYFKTEADRIYVWDLYKLHVMGEKQENQNVKVVAHRGASHNAPENTLTAFRYARMQGFRNCEFDIQFTTDNVPVIVHDTTIDRTSNGSGTVTAMTYSQLSGLDFGSWFSTAFTGEKMPTLEQAVKLFKEIGLTPFIELKHELTTEQQTIVLNIVKKYGMQGKVWFVGNGSILQSDPDLNFVFITSEVNQTMIDYCTQHKNSVLGCNISGITESGVNLCMENNVELWAWTINTADEITALHPYVSGIITDETHYVDVMEV